MRDTPTPPELVKQAMTSLGAETQQDLVYELRHRYGFRASQSQVSRWGTRQGPSYEATMVLLQAAGWLATDRATSEATAGPVAAQLVAVAERLEALAAEVRGVLPSAPRREKG